MRNIRSVDRFLALLLSLCMLLTMTPIGNITVFAEEPESVISADTTWGGDKTLSGTVRIDQGKTLTINSKVEISGNVTITGGGTIKCGMSGANFNIPSGVSLSLDGVTIDGNEIPNSSSIFMVQEGTLEVKNSVIKNCKKSNTRGGAINMSGGTLIVEETTIENCSARKYGGAIYLDNGADVTIKSGNFIQNKTTEESPYGGGLIYNRESTLKIEGGIFKCNSSAGKGGVIYNTGVKNTKTYIISRNPE